MKRIFLSLFLVALSAFPVSAKTTTWKGGDGVWNVAANWNNGVPGAADTAIVGKQVTITFTANASISTLTINDKVTVTSGSYALTVSGKIDGSENGELVLKNQILKTTAGKAIPINVPLNVASGTANEIQCSQNKTTYRSHFVLNESLRGSGVLTLRATTTTAMRTGAELRGDNSEFAGTIRIYPHWASASGNQQYDQPSIATPEASSANALWELNVQYPSYAKTLNPGTAFFGTASSIYRFGALKANFYYTSDSQAYWAAQGITLEVGNLNQDSYAKGRCAPGDGVINWVATSAAFTNEVANLSTLQASGGGVMVIGSLSGFPKAITFTDQGGELRLASGLTTDVSGTFKNSTAPVAFNDQGVDHTWATAPDTTSNTGGFIKRGSGTLTWQTAPATAADVTVESGALAVPFGSRLGRVEISEGAYLKVDVEGREKGVALVILEQDCDASRLIFENAPSQPTVKKGPDGETAYVIAPCDYVWKDLPNANWSVASNWDPTGIPVESDSVAFTNAGVSSVCISQAASALMLAATNSLTLEGSYPLTVAMRLALAGELSLQPNPMSGTSGADAYGAANRLGVTTGVLAIQAISGEGTLAASGYDLRGVADVNESKGFVGSLAARDFTKCGAGVYKLIGSCSFSGTLAVEEGTLVIGTYRHLYNARFDFDASETDTLELSSNDRVTTWKSRKGDYSFSYDAGQHAVATVSYFDGKNTLYFRPDAGESTVKYSRYKLSPANSTLTGATKSLFFVYEPVQFISQLVSGMGNIVYGWAESSSDYGNNIHVNSTNKRWFYGVNDNTEGIFTKDVYGSATVSDGQESLVFWSDTTFSSEKGVEYVGTVFEDVGFKGVIAEVVGFTNTLTHVEREVVTKQLMHKWGLGYADYLPINPTAALTMKAGATLDLDDQTVTMASFVGAGTIQNGVLVTADARVTQSGGSLTLPAVEGTTYVLSRMGEKLVLTESAGKNITVVIPRTWYVAGRSGKRAIYCPGATVTWDTPRGDKGVDEGDGWYSLPSGGTTIRVR